ncbi:MAG: tetratricopeptide repeat protein, partial [Armatimonadetes bacterium]|nr:tetratricopeptide repeat protein [Armatimonadota bacterium]
DIRHSVKSKAKHYNLLVGPRGFGKTHFVAIIHNRVLAEEALKDKLLVAWLREEERGVTSFLELLMRILMALARQYPDSGLEQQTQCLYDLSRKEGERAAAELLIEFVGKRTLLLIIENLDSIFVGLKDVGQRALRAFLQEHPICTILATSTALFSGVSLQTSVFYGFFHINHLDELSLDGAIELLASIAQVKGDTELAAFIRTPTGRARIRAVDHLAGGNHRVYVVFSEFLTVASLDELVNPFMRMLDDLTPYYQGRMELLSPQQQQIVEFLAHAGGAQTVKEIARRSFVTQQTAANQLKDLKEKGYLIGTTPQSDKRETYYELREPLMRLCFEVKEYRGGPIRLFVDFLRYWYSRDELSKRLENAPMAAELERACLREALDAAATDSQDPRVAACTADLRACMRRGDRAHALQISEELVAVLDSLHDATPDDMQFDHWNVRALALFLLSRYDESLAALDKALKASPTSSQAWMNRGLVLQSAGRHADALSAFEKASALDPGYEPVAARVDTLMRLRRFPDALALLEKEELLLLASPVTREANRVHGQLLLKLGRSVEGLSILTEVIEHETDVTTIAALSMALMDAHLFAEALRTCRRMSKSKPKPTEQLGALAVASITALKSESVTASDRERWLKDFTELVGADDDLALPLRLLEAAVAYLNTGDDRALLALPAESRPLVQRMLSRQSLLWEESDWP